MLNTEELLFDWGKWQRTGCPMNGLGYKSPAAIMMREHVGGGVSLPPIPDDQAVKVDQAICLLGERSPELKQVVYLYFAECRSIRNISSRLKVSIHQVRDDKTKAVAWIDGVLNAIPYPDHGVCDYE